MIRLNPELIPTIWKLSWFPFSTARGKRPISSQPTFTGCCIHQTHQDWKSYIPRVQVARRHWHHLGTDRHFLSTKTFSLQLSGNTWKVGCGQTSTEHKLTQMKRTAVRSNLAAIHIHMHSRIADFDTTKRERERERQANSRTSSLQHSTCFEFESSPLSKYHFSTNIPVCTLVLLDSLTVFQSFFKFAKKIGNKNTSKITTMNKLFISFETHLSHKKNSYFPLYWLVNWDPSLYNRVISSPIYPKQPEPLLGYASNLAFLAVEPHM